MIIRINPRGTILFIADILNHAILRMDADGKNTPMVIVVSHGKERTPNQLFGHMDVTFDRLENLYVFNSGNARIQMFSIDKRHVLIIKR